MIWTAETVLTTIGQQAGAECITEQRLVELTKLTPKQVENACQRLLRHEFIARSGQGCHRLLPAGIQAIEQGQALHSGPKGPQESGQRQRNPGMRQRIWNALRSGKKLTIDDVIMRVAEGDEQDPRSNVGHYIRALAQAGYVLEMPIREKPMNLTSNGAKRWLLISDTGPLAPTVRVSRKTIYDPNLEREVAMAREVGDDN